MATVELAVPVEQVQPRDVIRRPSGSSHVVLRVEAYPEVTHASGFVQAETFVIVYRSHEKATYERKATDRSGFNTFAETIELSWKPLRRGELVTVRREA